MHYMEVTRELVHEIPSQLLPQGSDPTQLGGVFVQSAMSDFRAVTASKIIISSMSSLSIIDPILIQKLSHSSKKKPKKKKRTKLLAL